ncbi:LppX_LprAFG lipoprotein [Janibacter sp. G56]|uniref:LppX_LprAFG lipoprotein n=1 Tax=Janibacter sp. G56 TaxID=3418717 RepID=UPI003D015C54
MRRRTTLRLVTLVLPAALLAAGCSGGDDPAADPAVATPAQAFADAKAAFDEAGAVTIDLTSTGLPKGQDGVSSAQGTGLIDPTTPKFKGRITAVLDGTPGAVDLITIGDDAWMTFFTEDYNPVDLATLGAPNPSTLFSPKDGLSSLLPATTEAKAGEQKRVGRQVLRTYTGVVPAERIQRLLSVGDDATSFDVTYAIDEESGQLVEAVMSGEFFAGDQGTYTVVFSDYGKSIAIARP